VPQAGAFVKALGEVVLRVADLDAMQHFYADTLGLPLLRRFPHSAFFKLAEGHGGHPQALALFDRSIRPGYAGVGAERSTLDHLAFEIDQADFDRVKQCLEARGLAVRLDEHGWVQCRSLYIHDPEGNEVDFVCFDPSVPKEG